MDNEEKYRENWPKIRERLQKDYPFLRAQDLEYPMGHQPEMMKSLSERIGVSEQSLIDMIDSFIDVKKEGQ